MASFAGVFERRLRHNQAVSFGTPATERTTVDRFRLDQFLKLTIPQKTIILEQIPSTTSNPFHVGNLD